MELNVHFSEKFFGLPRNSDIRRAKGEMVTTAQVLAGAAAMLATVQSGAAFVAAPSGRLGLPQLVAHAPVRSPPRENAHSGHSPTTTSKRESECELY